MNIEIDSNMRVSMTEDESAALVFIPDVNWNNIGPTIIDTY